MPFADRQPLTVQIQNCPTERSDQAVKNGIFQSGCSKQNWYKLRLNGLASSRLSFEQAEHCK
jgi:hypothetical protein